MVYQDETTGSKNWGHGIWIINKTTTSLPKRDGVTAGRNRNNFQHASLSGVTGILEVIESYYAPTPPNRHTYKFYLFGVGNGLTQAQIKTELDKVKRTADFNLATGAGGIAPAAITDRAAKIKELLGANTVQEATSIEVGYPKP